VNEASIVLILILHSFSYGVVASRYNARLGSDQAAERISMFIVGPRSLGNLWKFLFGFRFVQSGDTLLVIASVVHLVTTLYIVGAIVFVLRQ
jgi:hypothetical protein